MDNSVYSYGTNFSAENQILLDLAKFYDVRNVRSIPKLSELWDQITTEFNEKSEQNLSKKQLQKRLTNLTYCQRKKQNIKCQDLRDEDSQTLETVEQVRIRVELAREKAEIKREMAEEARLKKQELLQQKALADLKEAEARFEIAKLELEEKRFHLKLKQ